MVQRLVILALFSCICLGAQRAWSQAPGSGATFRTGVDIVSVPVTVQTRDGSFVHALGADRFHVFENGVEQPIALFGAGEIPVDLVLMIDTSASMSGLLPAAQRAATVMVRSLADRDRAAVFSFGGRVAELSPLTDNRQALSDAIVRLRPSGGTPLYEAVYVALKQFGATSEENGLRRRAVVVLSDGDDTASHVQFDDLLTVARQSGVALYMIIVRADSLTGTDQAKRAAYEMRALARETGAQAFFPHPDENLDAVYASIAHELANQYSLGLAPTRKTGHAFVRLSVRVDDARVTTVRTRSGYIAGN